MNAARGDKLAETPVPQQDFSLHVGPFEFPNKIGGTFKGASASK